MDYKKYYDLENYLLMDVRNKFLNDGFLSAADFFCIVIWKANRAKSKIKKKLLKIGETDLEAAIKMLTKKISSSTTREGRLSILLEEWKFGLPMATAILTILYPDDFSVYDYRVKEQLKLPNITTAKKYFSVFLPAVKALNYQGSLRDKDRYFWGKSFYEDLLKLVNS